MTKPRARGRGCARGRAGPAAPGPKGAAGASTTAPSSMAEAPAPGDAINAKNTAGPARGRRVRPACPWAGPPCLPCARGGKGIGLCASGTLRPRHEGTYSERAYEARIGKETRRGRTVTAGGGKGGPRADAPGLYRLKDRRRALNDRNDAAANGDGHSAVRWARGQPFRVSTGPGTPASRASLSRPRARCAREQAITSVPALREGRERDRALRLRDSAPPPRGHVQRKSVRGSNWKRNAAGTHGHSGWGKRGSPGRRARTLSAKGPSTGLE